MKSTNTEATSNIIRRAMTVLGASSMKKATFELQTDNMANAYRKIQQTVETHLPGKTLDDGFFTDWLVNTVYTGDIAMGVDHILHVVVFRNHCDEEMQAVLKKEFLDALICENCLFTPISSKELLIAYAKKFFKEDAFVQVGIDVDSMAGTFSSIQKKAYHLDESAWLASRDFIDWVQSAMRVGEEEAMQHCLVPRLRLAGLEHLIP